jgi:tetratricopeptide (TPR) repeat protein
LEGLAKLLAHQRTAGSTNAAIQTGLKLLALDPLQEPVHRTLMRLYAGAGRRGAALRQYQQCVGVLQRELGVEPEAETQQLYQEILRQRPSSHPRPRAAATPVVAGVLPRAEPAAADTDLVERVAEMGRLRQLLQDATGARGRLAVVLGEAGIGKTRLVGELAIHASDAGARLLLGRSYESEQILAFGPWVDAFRGAGLTADAEPVSGLEPVWRGELARLLPELGVQSLDSAADSRRVFEAIGHLVRRLAMPSPLVLVLEDLHWADEMSCRLLAFLGRRLSEWPLLIVATAREEDLPDAPALRGALDDLERERKVEALTLGPLSRAGTAELVRGLARAGTETQAIARLGERVWAASEGNPLMAVETVRALREGDRAVPRRVREVVTRRLDRLSERAQHVVAVAAVLGREFEFPLLLAAAGMGEDDAAHGMEELVRRRVLHGVGERFDFTHDRVREVAYGRLLSPRRTALHRRIAEALEARRVADAGVEALALGLHYRQAEVWGKAVEYLRQAGTGAADRGAFREAAQCFEEALAGLRHLPESRERMELEFEIRSDLRATLIPLGDLHRQVETLRANEALAEALGDRTRLAQVLAATVYTVGALGDHARAVEAGERGRQLAEDVGDFGARVIADSMLGRAYYALGQYERAIESAGRAVAALTGDLAYQPSLRLSLLQSVSARIWVAMSLAERGRFAEAAVRADEAMEIARVAQGTHERVWSHFGAGRVCLVQGRLERAVERLEPILPLARGDLGVYLSRIASTLGTAHLLAGRTAEAIPLLEQAAEQGQAIGFMHGHSLVLALLAEGYHRVGRAADASRTATEALELARRHRERGWEAWTLRIMGELTFDAAHYRAASALAEELGMRPLQAHCHLALGRLTGDRALLAAALEAYRAMDMTRWLRQVEPLRSNGA